MKLNERFEWQREYRFVFEAAEPQPDPLILEIGPLQDVSMLMALDELKQGVSFRFDDNAGGSSG